MNWVKVSIVLGIIWSFFIKAAMIGIAAVFIFMILKNITTKILEHNKSKGLWRPWNR